MKAINQNNFAEMRNIINIKNLLTMLISLKRQKYYFNFKV